MATSQKLDCHSSTGHTDVTGVPYKWSERLASAPVVTAPGAVRAAGRDGVMRGGGRRPRRGPPDGCFFVRKAAWGCFAEDRSTDPSLRRGKALPSIPLCTTHRRSRYRAEGTVCFRSCGVETGTVPPGGCGNTGGTRRRERARRRVGDGVHE